MQINFSGRTKPEHHCETGWLTLLPTRDGWAARSIVPAGEGAKAVPEISSGSSFRFLNPYTSSNVLVGKSCVRIGNLL